MGVRYEQRRVAADVPALPVWLHVGRVVSPTAARPPTQIASGWAATTGSWSLLDQLRPFQASSIRQRIAVNVSAATFVH